MKEAPPAIDARGLGLAWPGGGVGLADVSFLVEQGEKVALVGRNGAGKSTLLRLLAGRLTPGAGELRVGGDSDPRRFPARVAYLPQEVALDPEMTAGETLGLIAALLGLLRERVDGAAATFGLEPHLAKPVAELSGGWRRRLDLALFLLEEKEILLLDEPASGLDAAGEEILFTTLETRAAAGAAILVAGHDLARLGRFTGRALLFAGGRLCGEGAPEDFAAALTAPVLESPPGGPPERAAGGGRGGGRGPGGRGRGGGRGGGG